MKKKKKADLKLIAFFLIIILILVLNKIFGWSENFSDIEKLTGLKTIIENNRLTAFLIYSLITIFACVVLALPGITFAFFAGILFGPFLGTFACLTACTIGAAIAFLVGRFFLKDSLKPVLKKNRLLKNLLFGKGDKNKIIVLMITRLVPLFPYNIQNFAYGITDISFFTYTLFTFVFMLPGVAFFTIGSAGLTAGEDRWLYFTVAGVLAVAVTLLGLFIKKKFLKEEISERKAYVIMTRLPKKGETKTRLMPFLGADECKELHECFLKDISEKVKPEGADIFAYYLGEKSDEELIRAYLPGAEPLLQEGKDEGEKMFFALKMLLTDLDYDKAVLTGTDIPEMSSEIIEKAFDALDDSDIVINPTRDGGYYLIGMKNPCDIFRVEKYGVNTVFEETVRNAEKKKLKVAKGEELSDLDTEADFRDLAKEYKSEKAGSAVWEHTEKFIMEKLEKAEKRGCAL